jgi:hypothetical protein
MRLGKDERLLQPVVALGPAPALPGLGQPEESLCQRTQRVLVFRNLSEVSSPMPRSLRRLQFPKLGQEQGRSSSSPVCAISRSAHPRSPVNGSPGIEDRLHGLEINTKVMLASFPLGGIR